MAVVAGSRNVTNSCKPGSLAQQQPAVPSKPAVNSSLSAACSLLGLALLLQGYVG